ncbi:MAG: hypothetical protein HYV09_08440 [Deltaproteobacteria bacterium]|nr:hypothetical protein [Deltaproteobacteria bacterium]
MSTLLARALERADLDPLVLGALADRLREAERGDVVRVHLDRPGDDGVRTFGRAELDAAGDGRSFLRAICVARLAGDKGAALRVDAEAIGLPLAQVALAHGADELVAPIARLSLEVFGGDEASANEKAVLRERELCTLVRCAGRTPRIVEHRGGVVVEREPDTTSRATRRFRAPGREVAAEREAGDA